MGNRAFFPPRRYGFTVSNRNSIFVSTPREREREIVFVSFIRVLFDFRLSIRSALSRSTGDFVGNKTKVLMAYFSFRKMCKIEESVP